MAAQVSRKQETNVVGDQKNWEQRVTSELEVAKVWCDNWGSLFDGATTQQQQIASLEDKLQRMPGSQGGETNYQLSFTGEPPFDEYPVGLMQKKQLRMEDVEALAKEMMAAQHHKHGDVATSR